MDDPANPHGVLESGPSGLPAPPAPEGVGLMATPDAASSSAGVSRAPVAGTQLETTHGRTTIADAVVARTAALAVRSVPGVHAFGRPSARALAGVTGRLTDGRSASAQGVTVEVGPRSAAIDVTVVVEYGVPLPDLARAVRGHVVEAVEAVTGLDVVEVNIDVADLLLPSPVD